MEPYLDYLDSIDKGSKEQVSQKLNKLIFFKKPVEIGIKTRDIIEMAICDGYEIKEGLLEHSNSGRKIKLDKCCMGYARYLETIGLRKFKSVDKYIAQVKRKDFITVPKENWQEYLDFEKDNIEKKIKAKIAEIKYEDLVSCLRINEKSEDKLSIEEVERFIACINLADLTYCRTELRKLLKNKYPKNKEIFEYITGMKLPETNSAIAKFINNLKAEDFKK